MSGVVPSYFWLNAIEIADDGSDVGGVAVFRTIEVIGSAVAEDDVARVEDEVVEEGVGDV